MLIKQLRPALVSFILLTFITGVLYPLMVTAIAQIVFPVQANGSILLKDGKAVGSGLIGQQFDAPGYFWGRLSATAPFAYNAAASSGSNYGPLNVALLDAVKGRVQALKDADPSNAAAIPVDLVTASGSGLDPHISIEAAQYQVARVAKARGISEEMVKKLVDQFTEGRQFGFLGEPVVNVLKLNLALDAIK